MSLTCMEFRRIVGAIPGSRDARVLEHRLQCQACADFAVAQKALDRSLEVALHIDVPEDLKARVIWSQMTRGHARRLRWLSVAAGLLLAVGLGTVVVGFDADGVDSLASAVIAHVEHEPELLTLPDRFATPVEVSAVINRGGAGLAHPLENVVHAGLCPFRGRLVPHLVVHVDGEPVSVLLLPNERIGKSREIHEDGYHGVLVPRDDGSMAIVAPRPDLVLPVREQLERAVSWKA